jgi:hypothetical protein
MNYLLEYLAVGAALLGLMLVQLARRDVWRGYAFAIACLVVFGTVAIQPFQMRRSLADPATRAPRDALLARIAAADKPVVSADMVLLKRAGKPVLFEPYIVTELALGGQWDETALVAQMRSGAFAFVITEDDDVGGSAHRTPAMDAAMRQAYPRVEKVAPRLWVHSPAS